MTTNKMPSQYKPFPPTILTDRNLPAPHWSERLTQRIPDNPPRKPIEPETIPATSVNSKPEPLPITMFNDIGHGPRTRECKICHKELTRTEPSVRDLCGYQFHAVCATAYLKTARAAASPGQAIQCPACECTVEYAEGEDKKSLRSVSTVKNLQRAGSRLMRTTKRAFGGLGGTPKRSKSAAPAPTGNAAAAKRNGPAVRRPPARSKSIHIPDPTTTTTTFSSSLSSSSSKPQKIYPLTTPPRKPLPPNSYLTRPLPPLPLQAQVQAQASAEVRPIPPLKKKKPFTPR